MTEWHVIDEETPPERMPLMVTGPSGCVTHKKFLALAYYDEGYSPSLDGETPWLGVDNDALADNGWRPTHWAYSIQLPEVV